MGRFYGDLLRVDHEPFQKEYETAANFSAFHEGKEPVLTPEIVAHLDCIEKTLTSHCYVETGWPAYGLLPHLMQRFRGRIKVVHLYREPLRVASSLTTHAVYSRDEWTQKLTLTPTTPGVTQPELAEDHWRRMTEFEKCLFWWTEINAFALRLRNQHPSDHWLDLKFESVFNTNDADRLADLARFLEIPVREAFLQSRSKPTDNFVCQTTSRLPLDVIHQYAAAVSLAKTLG